MSEVYGCGSPRLDAYDSRPKPGDTITISGRDLGVGGSVMLGDRPLEPADWSAGGFEVVVPEDAAGTLGLTVNCGRVEHDRGGDLRGADNRFSIAGRVRWSGRGRRCGSGFRARASSRARRPTPRRRRSRSRRPRRRSVKIKLTSAGKRALARAKSHTLKVTVRVRFTPAGGRPASKTVTVTFKRGSGR